MEQLDETTGRKPHGANFSCLAELRRDVCVLLNPWCRCGEMLIRLWIPVSWLLASGFLPLGLLPLDSCLLASGFWTPASFGSRVSGRWSSTGGSLVAGRQLVGLWSLVVNWRVSGRWSSTGGSLVAGRQLAGLWWKQEK